MREIYCDKWCVFTHRFYNHKIQSVAKDPVIFDIGQTKWKLLTSINAFFNRGGKRNGPCYFSRAVWDWGVTADDKCSFWPLRLICDFTAFRSAAMDTRYHIWPEINIIQFPASSWWLILTSNVSVTIECQSDIIQWGMA